MADPPDFEELARQYVDLWEDQLTAVTSDPELTAGLGRLFEAIWTANPVAQAAWAQWAALLQKSRDGEGDAHDLGGGPSQREREAGTASTRDAPTTHGSASAAAAPGDGLGRLDEFARRLADVESRLAALEKQPSRARRGARSTPAERKRGT